MTRVLVTGATGFVGRTLCQTLAAAGYIVRAALRQAGPIPPGATEQAVVGDMTLTPSWDAALDGIDHVMHTAARAHVLGDAPANADLYLKMNAELTKRLALAAQRAGVRRFVYVSSIKVNGEGTNGAPYTPTQAPQPTDSYGVSKLRAEQELLELTTASSMCSVIVRPPLVYGPGVRANFLRLLHWIDRGRVLPFGAVDNRRSLVSVWNLADLLVHVIGVDAAANRVWLVSDGHDLSTPELIRRIAGAMHRSPRLLSVPVAVLRTAGALAGRSAEVARLTGSLTVDISETRERLGWEPPVSVDEAIARTVKWYAGEGARGQQRVAR